MGTDQTKKGMTELRDKVIMIMTAIDAPKTPFWGPEEFLRIERHVETVMDAIQASPLGRQAAGFTPFEVMRAMSLYADQNDSGLRVAAIMSSLGEPEGADWDFDEAELRSILNSHGGQWPVNLFPDVAAQAYIRNALEACGEEARSG